LKGSPPAIALVSRGCGRIGIPDRDSQNAARASLLSISDTKRSSFETCLHCSLNAFAVAKRQSACAAAEDLTGPDPSKGYWRMVQLALPQYLHWRAVGLSCSPHRRQYTAGLFGGFRAR
jgi:hypothetical protein